MRETGRGCFYGVGIGPGDPELMTRKAERILRECDIIALPTTGAGQRAREIVGQVVPLETKELLELTFSMTKDESRRQKEYDAAEIAIETMLDQGKDVAMPNLGDVSIYATASYMARRLKSKGYETIMVAGVPSFCAMAATVGQSLIEGEESLRILPMTGDLSGKALTQVLREPGTKVLMKAGSRLQEILSVLEEEQREAIIVKDCGMESEEIFSFPQERPENTGYFTTILIKEPK